MSQLEIAGRAPIGVDVEGHEYVRTFFCACKRTANRPLCDGSHNKLT